MLDELRRRKWNWLGQMHAEKNDSIAKQALQCKATEEGENQRKPGIEILSKKCRQQVYGDGVTSIRHSSEYRCYVAHIGTDKA